MATWIRRWAAWLLPLALGFCCLRAGFDAAAALRALGQGGYSLRPAQPLTAAEVERLQKAAAEQELDLACWGEVSGEAVSELGRSVSATGVACLGEPSLAFGVRCLYGRLPTAAETDACVVTLALARALWGGEDVVGLELTWQKKRYTVCGVTAETEDSWLLYAVAGEGETALTGVELGNVPRGDPRGAAQQLVMTAGLGDVLAVPGGTLAGAAALLAWLPLTLAARVADRWLRRFQSRVQREALLFGVALVLAAALPLGLAALPGWLIPNRWSDFGFWTTLAALPGQTLRVLLAVPPSVRDTALRWELLRAAAAAAGALLALAWMAPGVGEK